MLLAILTKTTVNTLCYLTKSYFQWGVTLEGDNFHSKQTDVMSHLWVSYHANLSHPFIQTPRQISETEIVSVLHVFSNGL